MNLLLGHLRKNCLITIFNFKFSLSRFNLWKWWIASLGAHNWINTALASLIVISQSSYSSNTIYQIAPLTCLEFQIKNSRLSWIQYWGWVKSYDKPHSDPRMFNPPALDSLSFDDRRFISNGKTYFSIFFKKLGQ